MIYRIMWKASSGFVGILRKVYQTKEAAEADAYTLNHTLEFGATDILDYSVVDTSDESFWTALRQTVNTVFTEDIYNELRAMYHDA